LSKFRKKIAAPHVNILFGTFALQLFNKIMLQVCVETGSNQAKRGMAAKWRLV
jgi:hypothetical protein